MLSSRLGLTEGKLKYWKPTSMFMPSRRYHVTALGESNGNSLFLRAGKLISNMDAFLAENKTRMGKYVNRTKALVSRYLGENSVYLVETPWFLTRLQENLRPCHLASLNRWLCLPLWQPCIRFVNLNLCLELLSICQGFDRAFRHILN